MHHKGEDLPVITEKIYNNIFRTIAPGDGRGSKPKGGEKVKIKNFYDRLSSKLIHPSERLSSRNFGNTLTCTATTMLTAIEQNLSAHFLKRLRRLVFLELKQSENLKKFFDTENVAVWDELTDKEKKILTKKFTKYFPI